MEFLPKLDGCDFSGKPVALFGLGDQEQYPDHVLSAMKEGRFVGLALDQHLQHLLTDQRIDNWLDEVTPLLLEV